MMLRPSLLIIGILLTSLSVADAFQVNFTPRATVTETYSDNLDLTAEDTRSDFITTVSPGFTLSALGRTQGLDLSYDPSYSWYAEYAEYNTLRHDARLNAWNDLSRISHIELDNTFVYTEDPLSETQSDADIEQRSGREPYYQNTATLTLDNQFGPTDTLTLAYRCSMLENEDDEEEDSRENTPSLAWTYNPIQQIATRGEAAFTRGEFDESSDFERYEGNLQAGWIFNRYLTIFTAYRHTAVFYDQAADDNYHVDYPSMGLIYQAGEDTRMSVSGGYVWIEREKEDDEEGVLFSSDVSQTWRFRRGALGVNASSGYDESYFDEDNLGLRIYYQAAGDFSLELLQGVSAGISGSYRTDSYLNTDDDREDRTTTGGLRMEFSRIRNIALTLSYDYRQVDSTEDTEDYIENRIAFSVTVTPERPLGIVR